jgi:hypothetical protein
MLQVFESGTPAQVGPNMPRPRDPNAQRRKNGLVTIKSDRMTRSGGGAAGSGEADQGQVQDVVRPEAPVDDKVRWAALGCCCRLRWLLGLGVGRPRPHAGTCTRCGWAAPHELLPRLGPTL